MFTIRVDRGPSGGHSVYSAARYAVAMKDGGGGATLRLYTQGPDGEDETVVDVFSGHSVYVMNARGTTVDIIRPEQHQRRAAMRTG